MAVFVCVNANFDRMLIRAKSKDIAVKWIADNVEHFICNQISLASKDVLAYAKRYGEPIIKVKALP